MEAKQIENEMIAGDYPVIASATFGRYLVEIIADSGAENPWECWGAEPPIFTRDDSDATGYGEFARGLELPTVTAEQFRAHWRELIPAEFIRTGADDCAAMRASFDAWADAFGESWDESAPEDTAHDWACYDWPHMDKAAQDETAAHWFNAAGIPCEWFHVTGCAQRDWADVFVAWTPEFCRVSGCNPDDATRERLRATAELYRAWAFGDVAGYRISALASPCECCGVDPGPDELDSCWGFYGMGNSTRDNPDWSGIYDAIACALPDDAAA